MKKLFSLVLLLIASFTMSAQTVEWGVKNISKNAKYEPSVIAWNDEGIFCFADDNSHYYLEQLDPKTFKRQYQTEFEEPKFGKYKSTLEEVIYVNGNFMVFFSYYDNQKETYFIYAYEYNGENGRSTGKKEKIFEADVEIIKEKGHFMVLVSEDNSKILINHYAYSYKHDKMHDYYLLLNSDLETITTRIESFNVSDSDYNLSNYTLDNDGTLYYWKSYEDKSSIVSYDGNRDYDKWEETIELDARPNSYSVGGAYNFDQNGDFVIAGVWATSTPKDANSNKKQKKQYKGTYYIKIETASDSITGYQFILK